MSPPTVTITEATGEVAAVDPGIDRTLAVIGCCASGAAVSESVKTVTLFGTAKNGVYANRGEGPGTRLAGHVLKKNAAKVLVAYVRVPSSTPGSHGTPDLSAIVGTALPVFSEAPLSDYDLYFKVVDDGNDGAGTAIGTDGIQYIQSNDGGRNPSGTTSLGTAHSFTFPQCGSVLTFNPVADTLVAPANALRTAALAHFPKISSSIHGAADNSSDDGIGAACSTNANAITLINALRVGILAHFALGSLTHTAADTTSGGTANANIPAAAVTQHDALVLLNALIVAWNLHVVNLSYHGASDAANAVASTTPDPGTLKTNDVIQVKATGPKWSTDDLTNAFAALADSSIDFGMTAIAGPVSATEAATISAGADTLAARGKRPYIAFATRGMNVGEDESTWLEAVKADYSTFTDDRLAAFACPGRHSIDDGNRVRIFDTSALPNIVARIMGVAALSESPSWVDAGPLDGVNIVDSSGNLLAHAHDEGGDIQGLDAAHICTLRRLPDPTRRNGVYLTRPWVLFSSESRINFQPTRRVANKALRIAAAISWGTLGSAQIYIPGTVAGTGVLSLPAANIIKSKIQAVLASASGIRADISNPDDPDLVTVDRNVTVNGEEITVPISLNIVTLKYVGGIDLVLNIRR